MINYLVGFALATLLVCIAIVRVKRRSLLRERVYHRKQRSYWQLRTEEYSAQARRHPDRANEFREAVETCRSMERFHDQHLILLGDKRISYDQPCSIHSRR